MPYIDAERREIHVKIAFWGAALAGKTTNLKFIHERTRPELRSPLQVCPSQSQDGTQYLRFDFVMLALGEIRGFRPRFHLCACPGAQWEEGARRDVLHGADVVVFVADSQAARADANLEMMENLRAHLAARPDEVPLTLQCNKRDLPAALPVDELKAMLGLDDVPTFEASAVQGAGVFETLKSSVKQAVMRLRALSDSNRGQHEEPDGA
ncbi:MAG: GTPase domain-containing protein [Myxococcota bacterium]